VRTPKHSRRPEAWRSGKHPPSAPAPTHGANDAQKTLGVIALALFESGRISHFCIPTWVIVAAGLSIGAGTNVGGWRIMRTLGRRV
jgi:inorganic phosphate transporter, PiT family